MFLQKYLTNYNFITGLLLGMGNAMRYILHNADGKMCAMSSLKCNSNLYEDN